MSQLARIIPKAEREPIHARIRQDDYSIQVASDFDQMFWIRVEISATEPINVSDLKRSNMSPVEIALRLDLALSIAFPDDPRRLRFSDIAPSAAGNQSIIATEAAHIATIVVLLASYRQLKVNSIKRTTDRDKVHLDVELVPEA